MTDKLYEIDDQVEKILAHHVDMDTGEITPEAAQELDLLTLAREKVCLDVATYILGELAEAEMVEKQIARLELRKATHKKRANWLESYLRMHLQANLTKYSNPVVTIGWRKSWSVNVVAEDEVPQEYMRVEVKETVDKTKAKPVLKKGQKIPGLELQVRQNLQVK